MNRKDRTKAARERLLFALDSASRLLAIAEILGLDTNSLDRYENHRDKGNRERKRELADAKEIKCDRCPYNRVENAKRKPKHKPKPKGKKRGGA